MKIISLISILILFISCKKQIKIDNSEERIKIEKKKINTHDEKLLSKNLIEYDSITSDFLNDKIHDYEYTLDLDGYPILIHCAEENTKGYYIVRFYSKKGTKINKWEINEFVYDSIVNESKKSIFKKIDSYDVLAFSVSTRFLNFNSSCPSPLDQSKINFYLLDDKKWSFIKTFSNNIEWHQFLNDESFLFGKNIIDSLKTTE